MWRKPLLFSWYIIVSIIVLVAVVISIARGYPSIYQHYLPAIQENISAIVGKPVQARTIRIDWQGYTPLITVNDLAIYSDNAKKEKLLFAKKAHLSIDIYKSLIHKKVSIHQLTLVGSNLEAIRTAEERVVLNGIDISERIAKRKQFGNKSKTRISLLKSTIAISDEVKNLHYFFDRVDVVLGFDKDRFKVTSNFKLPTTLGNSLVLVADLKDFDQGLNNIRGSLYTKGENINLELISDFFPQLQVGINKGNSDFEVWGDFKTPLERSFKGSLNFRGLAYKSVEMPVTGIDPGQEITAFSTQFQIEGENDSWDLALINSDIQAAGTKWSGDKYEIACTDCGQSSFSIAAVLDYVDLMHVLATLQHFPIFSVQLKDLLAKAQIDGVLRDTSILTAWQDRQLTKYAYKAVLQDTAISMPSQEIEVSSLTAAVQGNHVQGDIDIDAVGVTIQANKLMDYSFEDQKIVGTVKWNHTENGVIAALEDISLQAVGLNANLQGSIQLNGGKSYLDIQGEVSSAQLTTIKTYMPYKKMRPKLVRWLKESLNGGTLSNGKFLFQGNPKHFPFKDQPGAFEVTASVENGVLDYRKDWPGARDINADFEIKNKHLTVIGHHGMILNSSIKQVLATIDDLKLPRLVIDGKARGPARDVLDYLQKSSLLPENSQIPKHISADGNTNLDLNLALTLTKKLEKERTVNGLIEFDNTNLTVTSISLPFTHLNGKLKFNRLGAEGQGLSAMLFGLPFNADARRFENGRTELTMTGEFDFDTYLSSNYEGLSQYIKGATPIKVDISLPRFGKHDGEKSLGINIDSNLEGIYVSLPKPFDKEPDEQKLLNVKTKYQTGKGYPLFANYNDKAFMQASLSDDGKAISAVEIRVGNEQFDLPENGLKISGIFDQLDVTTWQEIIQSPKPSSKRSAITLSEVNIQADVVSIANFEIQDVDFQLEKDSQSWQGEVNSSIAKGKFNYPLEINSESVAIGTFDYLHFNIPEKKTTVTLDPRILPALDLSVSQFKLDDYSFSDVALKTEAITAGMKINSLTGKGEDLGVNASGVWDVSENDIHSTSLDINLVTQDLHNSLTGLGFETGVSKGQGIIDAKLNWPNSPYQFSIDSFQGTANLRIKDGEISSVEPGAGRLVGLFNLGEITRRLSLDFSDFFSKGYVFEKIRGDLTFKDANLTTDNLSIKGPSADILIKGRTGIAAKDYDQVVTVTPHVSGGLPWIGLAVGGPLGAVGVIVGEKVAKTIGIDVNKVTEVKYSMTGSWDDPKIEPIAQKVAEAKPTVQGQPSPQSLPPKQASEGAQIKSP